MFRAAGNPGSSERLCSGIELDLCSVFPWPEGNCEQNFANKSELVYRCSLNALGWLESLCGLGGRDFPTAWRCQRWKYRATHWPERCRSYWWGQHGGEDCLPARGRKCLSWQMFILQSAEVLLDLLLLLLIRKIKAENEKVFQRVWAMKKM